MLREQKYDNITVRIGDGYTGWPEHAPFDIIIVTAAPEQVPQPLIDQLQPGGRLIVPVGPRFTVQQLQLIEKDASGAVGPQDISPVMFVPLRQAVNSRPMRFDLTDLKLFLHVVEAGSITAGAERMHLRSGRGEHTNPQHGDRARYGALES